MNVSYQNTKISVENHITSAIAIALVHIIIGPLTITEVIIALLMFAAIDIIFYLVFDQKS